jgi:pimeloyl-ACP methyl ester carboxylesterase
MTIKLNTRRTLLAIMLLGSAIAASPTMLSAATPMSAKSIATAANIEIRYKTIRINGVDITYREAGPEGAPAILLLHGFPTSSHMFRNLIPALADKYRVIAPDYPGFGQSASPDRTKFDYSFDNYAVLVEALTVKLKLDRYALYLMDYGAPVGFRLAAKHPERVTALIIQNGNAYAEGLQSFWDPIKKYWESGNLKDREAIRWLTSLKATKWQYTHGVRDESLVSPDTWTYDQALLDRPGNQEIQLDLFYDYRNNVPLYPAWQAYFRKHQPATLIVWGKNDQIFVAAGAEPYKRDLNNVETHLLDAGHFALETNGNEIAGLIRDFLKRQAGAEKAN